MSPASNPPDAPIVTVEAVAPVHAMSSSSQPAGMATSATEYVSPAVRPLNSTSLLPGTPPASASEKVTPPFRWPDGSKAKLCASSGTAFFTMVIEPWRALVNVQSQFSPTASVMVASVSPAVNTAVPP